MADGVMEKHSIMDELLAVLARTADGVFALDQAERVVFWNAAAEQITGYRADEVLGRPCYEIFGSEQRTGCHKCQPDCPVLRAARNQEPVPTYNLLGRTKTGIPILLNISVIVPLERHGSVCTIHLFRDATHQLRYETYVEQILCAAAQLFGPQQTLVQRALRATPFSRRYRPGKKKSSAFWYRASRRGRLPRYWGSAMSRYETISRLSCANLGCIPSAR